jgi:hypothetical protein
MNKYDLIKLIVDKYCLEEDIEDEISDFLKEEKLTNEDIFKIKLTSSPKVQNAFSKGCLEKDFPSFLLLTIINGIEDNQDINIYKEQIMNNFHVEDGVAEDIIELIKKETLYSDTLYKVMMES